MRMMCLIDGIAVDVVVVEDAEEEARGDTWRQNAAAAAAAGDQPDGNKFGHEW